MFREIFLFEIRYQIRQPLFSIALVIFFLMSFGVVTTDSIQLGGALGNVNRNAPFVIMQVLLFMTAFGMFITTAFVASTVQRDSDLETREIFYATPITKRDFLLGRFCGAIVASLLIYAGVVLGIFVGGLMPWLEPERVGPILWLPYVASILIFVLPNTLLSGGMFFALATLTRSLMYTYAGAVLLLVGTIVSGNFLADLENEFWAGLVDPFGIGAFQIGTKYWTVAERNASIPSMEGVLLYNRLLWLGLGLALLAFTYARFRFTLRDSRRSRKRRSRAVAGAMAEAPPRPLAAPVAQRFSAVDSWRQFLHQTRMEVTGVLKSIPFLVIMLLGILNLVALSINMEQIVGTPVYPVTHLIINAVQGGFLIFVVVLLTLYSGEIVWRERSLKLDGVFDALPVRTWVLWGSKLSALIAVLVVLLAGALLAGIGIQAFQGYFNFEIGLYLAALGLVIGIPFALIGILALFFQVASNQRYLGYLLMVLYIVSLFVLPSLNLEHNLYQYAGLPSAPYSDMNGFGHFVQPLFWFNLYWAFGAAMIAVLIHLFWVRGLETRLRWRLALARQRLTPGAAGALGAAALGFILSGGFIFYNTNILNDYIPGDEQERRQAEFEKRYKKYEGLPGPRVTAAYADVDIYPHRRQVDIRGRYTLVNRTAQPLSTLHVTVNPIVRINAIGIPAGRLEESDALLGYYIYGLDEPLEPSAQMEVTFDLKVVNEGFVNNGSNTKVVDNGTFFGNYDYFPHFGYSRVLELTDPVTRRKNGLPPVQRFPPIDDPRARWNNYISNEADWVDFETTVSTSLDQIALAPGYLQREWRENGRRYFHYKMDAPILNFYSYLSADYAVKRDRWNDVAIEIYYDRKHPYNVDRMIYAIKKSLDYFTTEFGPYQHRQVRIVEFPRYARFAQSDPNTIPFSESIGFIARLEDEEEIDTVFYVTAHEVAHQWWAHQVIGGFVQGATVMSETMAQYSALMVMEKEYGREKMRKFLKYELDAYLRGRGGELVEELPLLLVENQPYIHYRKGSLVMYALRDDVGEKALNAALARYVRHVRFQKPPYTYSREFLDFIAEAVPEDRRGLLDDLFRNITLYENRATEATYEKRADGTYLVRLAVESSKFRADGAGVETAIPVDDWIDVGVFGAHDPDGPPEGRILALEKRHVDRPDMLIEIVVNGEPRTAGIDPFNKLIDRNPENNLRPATAVGLEVSGV